ncbi:MAG TPA: hypothetical protein VLL97_09345 [Acidobacteriota bacterium]|nr:hypothetical protein [Acidobacteriota bacterium]
MNDLLSHCRKVLDLYDALEIECSRIFGGAGSGSDDSAVDSVLNNRSRINSMVEEVNMEVMSLAGKLLEFRDRPDPKTGSMIRECAKEAAARAAGLQGMCAVQAEKVAAIRAELREKLDGIDNGSRLLKTLKPPRNNYPKFIDAMH